MTIAERITTLRKKEGWSQEELAERLDVSRQSVSKWESGASIPDINRILAMSELFGVSTDFLLKGSREFTDETRETRTDVPDIVEKAYDDKKTHHENDMPQMDRLMTVEEINGFMEATSEYGRKIARGVFFCILSPAVLIGMAGFADESGTGVLSENTAVLIGLICLFVMIAYAVMLFVRAGHLMDQYKFVKKGNFYLEQGSIEVIEGVLSDFEPQFSNGIAKGIAICIMSPMPLIALALIGFDDAWVVLMVPVLLLMVAVAVNIFIRMSVVKDGFLQLLKRKEFDSDPISRENARREEKLSGIYWPVVVAIYLLWSFLSGAWHISWVIFPIAGLIFSAINNALKK